MDYPLVSICCITYNHEAYIKDALEGFVMQKTNFPFEVIIHDDASTDNTAAIIKEYEKKYPEIIKPIYQTENQWSKGIRPSPTYVWPKAKGKYIAICEGDDYWIDSNKLQIQIDLLENNKEVSLCFHNAIIKNHFLKSENIFKVKKKTYFSTKDVILSKWFCPTASIVTRKPVIDLFLEKGIPENVINGDLMMLFYASLLGKLYHIDRTMSVYNIGVPGSLSAKFKKGKRLAYYKSKIYFLLYVNKITENKYFGLVYFKVLLVILAMIKSLIFRWK